MQNASRLVLVFASLLALTACADSRASKISGLEGDATAGATLFQENCQSCHGANGVGGSGPALAEEAEEPDEVISIVLSGEEEMPSFEETLSDQEIADIVAFLQTL